MKSRGFELPVDRPSFSFLAALKLLLLSALLVFFLNATFSLYISISNRYYSNPHPPFLRISSSSSFSVDLVSSSHLQTASPPVSGPPSSTSFESSPSSYLSLNSTLSPVPFIFNSPSSSYIVSTPSSPPPIAPPRPLPIPLLKPSSEPIPKLEKPSPSNFSYPTILPTSSPSSSPRPNKGIPKGCDLSRGEWIRDPNAPYYTNSTCYTIQEHQNCMKYGRPDQSFLKWRWKPDGCELPLLDPAGFLELMRGKNLAFIGDSLARNQMQSLMCLLSRIEYPEETWPPVDNVTQMWYRSYNFTVWAFWSPFLIRAHETMTAGNFGMWNLYLDEPDPLWQHRLGQFDHIVLNTGNWYTRPAHFHEKHKLVGCHYCVVKKVPFMSVYKAHRRAFRTALDSVLENREGFKGVAVVRTVSPSHFEGGEWNKGGDCRRTAPFERSKAKMKGMDLELYKDQMKEFWKAKWEGSEKGMEFRLLDTTRAMLMRPDGHPSRYGHWPHEERVLYNDCVHWCLPGPVDMWNDLLFQILSIQ